MENYLYIDCITVQKFRMLETPSYKCWYKYSETVYEPSEDTFVFLDGIEQEIKVCVQFSIFLNNLLI